MYKYNCKVVVVGKYTGEFVRDHDSMMKMLNDFFERNGKHDDNGQTIKDVLSSHKAIFRDTSIEFSVTKNSKIEEWLMHDDRFVDIVMNLFSLTNSKYVYRMNQFDTILKDRTPTVVAYCIMQSNRFKITDEYFRFDKAGVLESFTKETVKDYLLLDIGNIVEQIVEHKDEILLPGELFNIINEDNK